MEEIRTKAAIRTERLENEIVGIYEPAGREVVGVLTHDKPLQGKGIPMEVPRRKKKTGLWIFLLCMAVLSGAAAAAFFLPWTEAESPSDVSGGNHAPNSSGEADGFDGMDEFWGYDFVFPDDKASNAGVLIPTHPAGDTRLSIVGPGTETLTPQEIYSKVSSAVVTVVADSADGGASVGTGVIFSADGYMLTNYHVVQGKYACMVITADNAFYDAWYVAGDPNSDLAVLKIEGEGFSAAEIGDSSELMVGDVVYAIGSPLGTELRGTFTNGIVSAVNREVEVDGRAMILIQTNTALNIGNSGGPLINQYGQVVGITAIKMMSDYSTVEGLGFAIPTMRAKKLVNEMLAYGEVAPEPLLGITVEVLGTKLPDGAVGARIQGISPGSAAEAAGLLPEDIIVSAGGYPIHGSADVLLVRGWYSLGETMPMRVWRGGEYLDVALLLLQSTADAS